MTSVDYAQYKEGLKAEIERKRNDRLFQERLEKEAFIKQTEDYMHKEEAKERKQVQESKQRRLMCEENWKKTEKGKVLLSHIKKDCKQLHTNITQHNLIKQRDVLEAVDPRAARKEAVPNQINDIFGAEKKVRTGKSTYKQLFDDPKNQQEEIERLRAIAGLLKEEAPGDELEDVEVNEAIFEDPFKPEFVPEEGDPETDGEGREEEIEKGDLVGELEKLAAEDGEPSQPQKINRKRLREFNESQG